MLCNPVFRRGPSERSCFGRWGGCRRSAILSHFEEFMRVFTKVTEGPHLLGLLLVENSRFWGHGGGSSWGMD
jgi:hypothetical protein